jgi:hypothetical protein
MNARLQPKYSAEYLRSLDKPYFTERRSQPIFANPTGLAASNGVEIQ